MSVGDDLNKTKEAKKLRNNSNIDVTYSVMFLFDNKINIQIQTTSVTSCYFLIIIKRRRVHETSQFIHEKLLLCDTFLDCFRDFDCDFVETCRSTLRSLINEAGFSKYLTPSNRIMPRTMSPSIRLLKWINVSMRFASRTHDHGVIAFRCE